MENHATSKLSNVHPNNHELVNIMARRFRRDREPRRIPIRSLKRPLRTRAKRTENLTMHVFFHVYPCHLQCN